MTETSENHELLQELAAAQELYGKLDTDMIGQKISTATALAQKPTKETIEALLTAAADKGMTPKNALQLNDATMEAIYGQAYNLYNQGRYKEASYLFRLLMLLDYMTPKYALGLAACLHRLKDYKNAANVYLLSGTIDPKNPLPHYHAADCYLQLDLRAMAVFSLSLAIEAAGEQPQYSVIRERAHLMKESLEKELDAQIEQEKQQEGAKSHSN
ncbi:MAG: SycD/LcrH family type III secretion system chaperone [Chlamydia sp.]